MGRLALDLQSSSALPRAHYRNSTQRLREARGEHSQKEAARSLQAKTIEQIVAHNLVKINDARTLAAKFA